MHGCPELQSLSCGCKLGVGIENGGRVLHLMPCSDECPNYRLTIEESKRRGRPIQKRYFDVN